MPKAKVDTWRSTEMTSRSTSHSRATSQETPCRLVPVIPKVVMPKVDTWRSAELASRSTSHSRASSQEHGLKERSASKESSVRSLASRSTCCPSSVVSEHELKQRLASQDDEIKFLRQERNFYFEKLRNAELLCESVEISSDPQVAAVIQELQQI